MAQTSTLNPGVVYRSCVRERHARGTVMTPWQLLFILLNGEVRRVIHRFCRAAGALMSGCIAPLLPLSVFPGFHLTGCPTAASIAGIHPRYHHSNLLDTLIRPIAGVWTLTAAPGRALTVWSAGSSDARGTSRHLGFVGKCILLRRQSGVERFNLNIH